MDVGTKYNLASVLIIDGARCNSAKYQLKISLSNAVLEKYAFIED